jgi:hypothetical protein
MSSLEVLDLSNNYLEGMSSIHNHISYPPPQQPYRRPAEMIGLINVALSLFQVMFQKN